MIIPPSGLLLFICLPLSSYANDRCSSRLDSQGKAWLETKRQLRTGRATALTVTFCESKRLMVQIWEESGAGTAKLEWQKEIVPQTATGQSSLVQFSIDEYIDITTTHRLGLYLPDGGTFPVPWIWSPNSPQLVSTEQPGNFITTHTYALSDLGLPYRFAIDFCYGKDCYFYENKTSSIRPTTVPTSPPMASPLYCDSVNHEQASGKVLLETSRTLIEGTLRAIRVSACHKADFFVQLWRQIDTNVYQLVWNKFISSSDLANTDGKPVIVDVSREEYINMNASYRLGLHSPDNLSGMFPIPYSFGGTNGGNLVRSTATAARLELCSQVDFDDLLYPHQFLIDLCNTTNCQPGFNLMQADTSYESCSVPKDSRPDNPGTGGNTEVGERREESNSANLMSQNSWHLLTVALGMLAGLWLAQ